MRRLRPYVRPLLLAAATTSILASVGWSVRFRVAVEVQLRAMGHRAARDLRHSLGAEGTSNFIDILSGDGDPRRRRCAAWRLADSPQPDVVPALIRALSDDDETVQLSAYSALTALEGFPSQRLWMRPLSDDQLVELVRQARSSSLRSSLFLAISKHRRSAMPGAGDALLADPASLDKLDILLCLMAVGLREVPTPDEARLAARIGRLGADHSDARVRHCCRRAVAQVDARSLSDEELVDWEADLEQQKYEIYRNEEAALIEERLRRYPAHAAEVLRKALESTPHVLLAFKLEALVEKLVDPSSAEEVLGGGLLNPSPEIRDWSRGRLESFRSARRLEEHRREFEERMRKIDPHWKREPPDPAPEEK